EDLWSRSRVTPFDRRSDANQQLKSGQPRRRGWPGFDGRWSSRERADVFGFSRLDQLERLVRPGRGFDQFEDVPLVLRLVLLFHLDDEHLLQELMVPVPERTLAVLQEVDLQALLENLNQLICARRLRLAYGLRYNFCADIVAPSLVVG